jgi:hypothetical protein
VKDVKDEGWIMQKVTFKYDITNKDGVYPPFYDMDRKENNPKEFTYWELWHVYKGHVYQDEYLDTDNIKRNQLAEIDRFAVNHQLLCTKGTISVEGTAIFLPKVDLSKKGGKTGWGGVAIPQAGPLLATIAKPKEWDDSLPSVKHSLTVKYDFTPPEKDIKDPEVTYEPK